MGHFLLRLLKVVQLQTESGTAEGHSLDKEARKWASRVAREYKSIIHTQRVSIEAHVCLQRVSASRLSTGSSRNVTADSRF